MNQHINYQHPTPLELALSVLSTDEGVTPEQWIENQIRKGLYAFTEYLEGLEQLTDLNLDDQVTLSYCQGLITDLSQSPSPSNQKFDYESPDFEPVLVDYENDRFL